PREIGILPELLKRRHADEVAFLLRGALLLHLAAVLPDGVVHLRGDQMVALAGLRDFEAVAGPRPIRSAQRVAIETDPAPDAAGTLAPVAQMHGDRVIGVTRHDPDGSAHRATLVPDLDHILVMKAAALCRRGTHHRRVVPGELGERLG